MQNSAGTQKADTQNDLRRNPSMVAVIARQQVENHREQRRAQRNQDHCAKACGFDIFFPLRAD